MNKLRAGFFILSCVFLSAHAGGVKLGVDILEKENFAALEGKKVGLVAHPASVDSRLVSTVDILRKTDRCKLTALFGPEHGVYGDEYAGVQIEDRADSRKGLPVYSLYGKTRKPAPDTLKELDALVFDLQDIGSRSYTYISTMKLCLEACADAGIEFVVLDRPNPLGGERIEGPMLEKGFESFIGAFRVPYLHGMTMGELAQMVKEEIAPHYQKLKIVKMSGWKRSMIWNETGLRWVPTSPHIPHASTCAFYAATGILGELGQVCNGVGYPKPFELVGAPWIKADETTEALNRFWMDSGEKDSPQNIRFRATRFKPFYGAFKDKPCEGVQIFLDPKKVEALVEVNFCVLLTLDAPKLFERASSERISMFDKACGSDEARKWLVEGRDITELFEKWKAGCAKFRDERKRFLLYD